MQTKRMQHIIVCGAPRIQREHITELTLQQSFDMNIGLPLECVKDIVLPKWFFFFSNAGAMLL
jgi:hypothetical protein